MESRNFPVFINRFYYTPHFLLLCHLLSFGSLMDITGYYETSGSTKKMSLIWKTIPWIINNLMVNPLLRL